MPRHIKQGTYNPYFWRTFHVQYLSSLSSNQLLISAAPWLPCVLPTKRRLFRKYSLMPKRGGRLRNLARGHCKQNKISIEKSAVLTWTQWHNALLENIRWTHWTPCSGLLFCDATYGAQDNRNLSSDFAVSNLPENKKKELFWITVHDRKHIWCFHMRTLPLFSLPTPASQWAWWWSKNRGNPFPQVWS